MWIRKKTQYGGDVVTVNFSTKNNVTQKTSQYVGYVVMFLPNKIIINKKFNYPQKNVGLAHGFKTMCNAF